MARGIGDGDGATLRHAEQLEFLQSLRFDDGLEILDPRLKRIGRRRPVRQSAAPLVVPDVGMVLRQRLQPVRPDRASRILFDMAEPVSSAQQWRPAADRGHRDLGTVTRLAEPDLLIKPRHYTSKTRLSSRHA